MAIKPILHRILVKPDDVLEKDKNYQKARELGLILAEKEREREQAAIDTGVVVDFGPTVFSDFHTENPLSIGDTVVYARYAGKVIVDPATEVKYVALNDEDVIAVITTEGA
jgi:co-chaperonin GroES (HSP10)